MTFEPDPSDGSGDASRGSSEPIAGDPSLAPPAPTDAPSPATTPLMEPPTAGATTPTQEPQAVDAEDADDGGGKVKTAAVVAGAAALANKVRQEAPKVLHQLRERRVAGRRVIITEVDGQFLAIGPYKNEDDARQDAFKVGGTPHVAELVSDTTFFATPEQP